MADSIDRLVTQFKRVVDSSGQQQIQVEYGNFVAAEAVDSNLSTITLNGKTLRFVPKMKHVELAANDIVAVMSGAGMLKTIIGVHVGDVTLASEEV